MLALSVATGNTMLSDKNFLETLVANIHTLSPECAAELSPQTIYAAMSAVYYASIRREEGEKVLPHLMLVTEQSLQQSRHAAPILASGEAEPVTPELLRKRSLAFDRRSSSFLATVESGELKLYGVVHWGWRGDSAEATRASVTAASFDAEDTGTVVISFGRTRLGVFRDGNFYTARGSIFTSPVFKRSLSGSFFRLQANENRVLAFMASLQHLVQGAMSNGLGGTIVVVDDTTVSIASCCESGLAVAYHPQQNELNRTPHGFNQSVLDRDCHQTTRASLTPQRRAYLYLDFLARLASIDGALILGDRLQPLRIGTKLRTPPATTTVYLGGSPDQGVDPVLRGVGTRHSSALNFVAHSNRAVAFTISSDGPVSAFGWVEDRLSWWKNAVQL